MQVASAFKDSLKVGVAVEVAVADGVGVSVTVEVAINNGVGVGIIGDGVTVGIAVDVGMGVGMVGGGVIVGVMVDDGMDVGTVVVTVKAAVGDVVGADDVTDGDVGKATSIGTHPLLTNASTIASNTG